MKRIRYTIHAENKFLFFRRHDVRITKQQIRYALENGTIVDASEDPKIQVSGGYDADHSLIVIYREEKNNLVVITFWIAERGRYERNIQ